MPLPDAEKWPSERRTGAMLRGSRRERMFAKWNSQAQRLIDFGGALGNESDLYIERRYPQVLGR